MIKLTTIKLDIVWLEAQTGGYFIWAENEAGMNLPPSEWVPLLFAWHEATFFGTRLDVSEWEGRVGVFLSAWTALDFFFRTPHASLADIEWSQEASWAAKAAQQLFAAIKGGAFKPDYFGWRQGQTAWAAGGDDRANQWLTAALNELIETNDDLRTAWGALSEQYPLLKSAENEALPFNEDVWLERIGWRKDDTPFTVGLRLSEPENDSDEWALDIVLRDKAKPERLVVWMKGNETTPPKQWRNSLDRIQREIELWLGIAPELQDANQNELLSHLTEAEAWQFLTDTSLRLAEAGTEVLLPSWWKELQKTNPKLKMKVKSSVGNSEQSFVGLDQLIQFDWKLATGGLELSEAEFRRLVEENRRLIQIHGKWVKLDPAFIKQMQTLMNTVKEKGLSFADVLANEFRKEAEMPSEENEDDPLQDVSIELNRHLETMILRLKQVETVPTVAIPEGFNGELRPYQKKGMEWLAFLRQYGLGALLADDMGLGKTVQTIAYLLVTRQEETEQPMLIICPTSVLGNWQKEFQRFAPDLRVYLHHGAKRASAEAFPDFARESDVVITSYNLAHLDQAQLASVTWHALCLDEAQNIKNAYTKQARAVKTLNAKHRIALTGTPIENRLTELWSIFDFLNPGYLGGLNKFREHFVNPIEKENDKAKIRHVQQLIRPFFMRRTKHDPEVELNLPAKQEQKEYCPLTSEQASLYEQIIEETFQDIESKSGIERRGYILSLLTKLKQICNHPALYLKEDNAQDLIPRSHKSEKLVEIVTAIREREESCLIFTQYVAMGKMIASILSERLQEPISFLHGGVKKTERDRMIERFQNEERHVIILSLKAGGTGLNLTAANHVIHYDRWWNPAVENQATDRAHRIGQKRFVHVHKLITTGTLEEKIDEMLERKQALSDDIIQSEHWITELPTAELRELFMLRHA